MIKALHSYKALRLPADIIAALACHGCRLFDDTHVSVLSRGLSNQNYLIRSEDRQYALRINSDASSAICHRQSEVANWCLAQDAMLAPQLHYVSADYKYYLSEFIQVDSDWSQLMTANSAHPLLDCFEPWPQAEKLLLGLLTGLSRLPPPINAVSVTGQWTEYLDTLTDFSSRHQLTSSRLGQWFGRYQQLISRKAQVTNVLTQLDACMILPQFSHRDLNPHNLLLKNNQLWCIDFEYACLSHPLVDLASVLATHRLSTTQRHWLISNYLHNHPCLTADALSAVPAAIELYWYFGCCWALLMASHILDSDNVETSESSTKQVISTCHTFDNYIVCFDDFLSLLPEN